MNFEISGTGFGPYKGGNYVFNYDFSHEAGSTGLLPIVDLFSSQPVTAAYTLLLHLPSSNSFSIPYYSKAPCS